MQRNRGLSAPPRLNQQASNALTDLPQPQYSVRQEESFVQIGAPVLRSDEAPTPRETVVVSFG